MDRQAEVLEWLQEYLGKALPQYDPGDVLGSLRYEGDDANELIEGFAERFAVDLLAFNPWYHYNANEPPNFRRYRPYDLEGVPLRDIPISVANLESAAESGRWMLDYTKIELRYFSPLSSPLAIIFASVLLLFAIVLAKQYFAVWR